MAPQLNTTRARQGRSGKPILWVLVISTVLAAAALFGSWAMKSNDLAATQGSNASKAEAAATFSTPEPTPRQNESTPPPAR
jgi:flagellar basal body-associated protein FliL